jgi:hypothetical protein
MIVAPYQIAIVGQPGKGKTMSFRNMNPETCGFINIEGKPLPFINNFVNYCVPKTWQEAYQKLIEYAKNDKITEVVFDSLSAYMEDVMFTARQTKKGYDVFNFSNETIAQTLRLLKQYPKDIFVTAHYELVDVDGGAYTEKRIKVKGEPFALIKLV